MDSPEHRQEIVGETKVAFAAVDEAPAPPTCTIWYMCLVALPRFAIMMGWAAQWAVLGPLLEILVSSSAVQLIQVVGPLCGLLVVPMLGVLSDSCQSKHGRRRPFIFWGAVTSIMAYVLLMFASDLGNWFGDTSTDRPYMTAIVVLCYIWTDISLNVTMVPVTLLMADVVGNRQVTGAVVTGVLSSAGLLVTAVYIAVFGPAHKSLRSFVSILIVLMGATSGVTCWYVTETPLTHDEVKPIQARMKQSLCALYTGIRLLPSPLGVYFVIVLLTTYGYTSYNGAKGQFFGLVVKGGASSGADVCGGTCTPAQVAFNNGVRMAGLTDSLQGIAFLYVMVLPWLVRRFGAKRIIVVGIVPQIFLVLMAFSKNAALDVSIAATCSLTQATVNLLIVPLIVHVVGHGQDNSLGLFNGALNSALCAGQFLNYVISAALVTTSMGYALPVFVGGVVSALAFCVALFSFHITMNSV